MLTVAHNIYVFQILFRFKQIDYFYIEAQVYKNHVTCHRHTELGYRYMYLVEAPLDHIMLRKNLFKLRIVQLYLMLYIKIKQHHPSTLQWRHNERDGVSNHQPRDYLRNRLFRRRSKKTLKLRVTGLCEGNSPVTGEFPAQRTSNAENVSVWWRHHDDAKVPVYTAQFACNMNHRKIWLSQ